MRRLKKAVETKIAMQHRHDQRRMERKAIKDSIRKKYGLYHGNLYQKISPYFTIRLAIQLLQLYLRNSIAVRKVSNDLYEGFGLVE